MAVLTPGSNAIAMDAAIEWMVLFRSGEAAESDQQRFAGWLAADQQHASAWAKVSGALDASFAPIRAVNQRVPGHGALTGQVMLQASSKQTNLSRRKLLTGCLTLGAVAAAATYTSRNGTMQAMVADLSTGTGERRTFDLPDGSSVMLNACSSVDVHFDGRLRMLRLHRGELIANVHADSARPFLVQTDCGTVRALGTRFLVRQDGARSFAMVLEHTVEVTALSRQTRVLREGEAVWFDRDTVEAQQTGLSGKAAWMDGMLSVHDEPLADVIAAIRPYRAGFIWLSPAAAQLRVLGAFPLDDTDRLLESLAQTLPIRVRQYSRWLVLVDTA
ncbi:fec operon regulator FecR [compost metagenome]